MRLFLLLITLFAVSGEILAEEKSQYVNTPYGAQKAVVEFYFDDPQKIASALFWLRSTINPLTEAPYNLSPEELDIKVVIHGVEVAVLARKNRDKYKDVVERMRYYAEIGVEFKVCALAAHDFGYQYSDFYEFVEVVPSAMNEIIHWQQKGYGLLVPKILEKKKSIQEIR
jgi:intracellular sulfur oxidation DsrE/DsrF family protein